METADRLISAGDDWFDVAMGLTKEQLVEVVGELLENVGIYRKLMPLPGPSHLANIDAGSSSGQSTVRPDHSASVARTADFRSVQSTSTGHVTRYADRDSLSSQRPTSTSGHRPKPRSPSTGSKIANGSSTNPLLPDIGTMQRNGGTKKSETGSKPPDSSKRPHTTILHGSSFSSSCSSNENKANSKLARTFWQQPPTGGSGSATFSTSHLAGVSMASSVDELLDRGNVFRAMDHYRRSSRNAQQLTVGDELNELIGVQQKQSSGSKAVVLRNTRGSTHAPPNQRPGHPTAARAARNKKDDTDDEDGDGDSDSENDAFDSVPTVRESAHDAGGDDATPEASVQSNSSGASGAVQLEDRHQPQQQQQHRHQQPQYSPMPPSESRRQPQVRHVATVPKPPQEIRTPYKQESIRLRDIFFYQDYICSHFTYGESFQVAIDELRSGSKTVEDLPLIEVLHWRGRYYGMGNRRLACFHYLFHKDKAKEIPCMVAELGDDDHCLPQGTGKSVRVSPTVQLDGVWHSRMRVGLLLNPDKDETQDGN